MQVKLCSVLKAIFLRGGKIFAESFRTGHIGRFETKLPSSGAPESRSVLNAEGQVQDSAAVDR